MSLKKIAIIIVIIITVLFFFFYFKNKNNNIKTSTIQKGNLSEEMILSGEINAVNHAKLSFETAGKIVFVGTTEGEKVNRGRLISKLDSTVLNSNYQIALSNLRIYNANAENVLDQVKGNDDDETYAQKDQRTTAEANKDKAYEAVISAKRNLNGASLYAPFDGIITYLAHPFTGVYTNLGTVEAEIIDPQTIYFDVVADQTEITKLSIDQKVNIMLDAFENNEYQGKVKNISFTPKIGETGAVYSIKVVFDINDFDRFKIAMTGDAKFIVSEKNDVLYVSNIFVKQDKDGSYLKIDKKGNKIYLKTGIESEDNIEVIGDIKEGQLIYD